MDLKVSMNAYPIHGPRALSSLLHAVLLGVAMIAVVVAAEPKSPWQASIDTQLESISALRGGQRLGTVMQGSAMAGFGWSQEVNPDGDVAFGAFASSQALFGRGPTEHLVGDFLALSNIEGHHSVRLYQWWGEARTRRWEIRVGALLADEDFAGTEVGGNFSNSAFGWAAFISANTVNTGPAFYAAAPGMRLRWNVSPTAYWQAGLYDGDTFDCPFGDPAVNADGLHLHPGGSQGWFGMLETGFQRGADGRTRIKLGGWFHTAKFADVYADADGQSAALSGADPRMHSGNFGGYVSLERAIAGTAGEAGFVQSYVRAGLSPRDRNVLGWALDGGLAVTGPLAARPADVLAVGVALARFSPRFRASQLEAAPDSAAMDSEAAVEFGYQMNWGEDFSVRPSLQYIRHPGGSSDLPDATVFLLRWAAQF
jgi:porin